MRKTQASRMAMYSFGLLFFIGRAGIPVRDGEGGDESPWPALF